MTKASVVTAFPPARQHAMVDAAARTYRRFEPEAYEHRENWWLHHCGEVYERYLSKGFSHESTSALLEQYRKAVVEEIKRHELENIEPNVFFQDRSREAAIIDLSQRSQTA